MDAELLTELPSLCDDTPVLLAVFDPDDRLRYVNRAFREAFFIELDEKPLWRDVLRRNHAAGRGAVVSSSDFESWICSVTSRRGKFPVRYFESDLMDGRCLWVVETVKENGWMQLIATDITKIRPSGRSLRLDRDLAWKAANTDELTGISNRRHIIELLEHLCSGDSALNTVKGYVCLVDIDHFKSVNDTWGHQAGDEALMNFSRLVRTQIRLQDGFGRIGGDEFLLVFNGYAIEEAVKLMGRLFDGVRDSSLLPNYKDARISFSAGITEFCVGDSVEGVLQGADKALYVAKQNGRDRLCTYENGELSDLLGNKRSE